MTDELVVALAEEPREETSAVAARVARPLEAPRPERLAAPLVEWLAARLVAMLEERRAALAEEWPVAVLGPKIIKKLGKPSTAVPCMSFY